MPKFAFSAISPEGVLIEGVRDAEDFGTAYRSLQAEGMQPVEVKPRKGALQFEITRKKVKRKDVMHFSRQLGVFVKAGIPLLEALEVIGSEQDDKMFKEAIADMVFRLEAGATFADAASAHPEAFPNFYVSILRSAEVTGNLDVVLEQLATYIERDIDARHKVTSALLYPAVVMCMSVGTALVLTIYVLPKFETFFSQLNAKLPLVTRMLLSFSHFMSTYWWALLAFVVFAGAMASFSVRTERGRILKDKALLGMPGFGDVLKHAILERFCRILSSMVSAGVGLDVAMEVTAEATSNYVYRTKIAAAREAMMRGDGLADPLAETGLFPVSARQMIRVGESTGTLDQQLVIAADYFDRELDHKIKKFTSLFEPAVIIIMGLLVGFVAVALVSAMYGIYGQVKLQ